MENLKDYSYFQTSGIYEEESEFIEVKGGEIPKDNKDAMSNHAKESLKEICENILCREADQYDEDDDDAHTYEGYVNECMTYLKEAMGQSGYSPIIKPHAE